jgi:dipeptidyl-peptidase-4
MASPSDPDPGFLEQYAATNRFNLGEPTSITVTPDGDAVLFLRSGPRSFVHDLWSFDVHNRTERRLLTSDQVLRGGAEHLAPEERARRERMRVTSRGIVSFQLSIDGRRILVPLAGRLFVVERSSGAVRELHGARGYPIDPQFSPDGSHLACARDNDLFVTDIATGHEVRLTHGGSDTLQHGVAEFVAQEEMDRFSGYWWSPDGRSIAYQETRLGGVEKLNILDPAHPEEEAAAWRYPRPGMPNAEVRLGIMPASGGPTRWVTWDHARYPYLATVRWEKNAPLTILVQNRRQTEEVLLAVDERDGSTRTLLIERDPAWINLDQSMPGWLDDGSAFLWMTERLGRWQLELHGRDGHLERALTQPSFNLRRFVDLDESDRVAWVEAGDDPTSVQLYRVHLDAGRDPEQVTRGDGIHGAVFAKNHEISVRSFSGAASMTQHVVIGARRDTLGVLRSLTERPRITTHLEFLRVGSRDYNVAVLRPSGFVKGHRYPVIVNVYGGPHSQMVMRQERLYLLPQWLADHGYIVVSIDGRGTPGRGREWERAIKNDLSAVPLADQIEALHALAARVPEMDLSRVGIYGWSFGGYFSAMATMRHPEVFRAGVVGAPVVDWLDYDTHYTERYMDLPESNPRGYEAASVLTYAGRLERPLLIVHGTVDDNVHFLNSMKLCRALFLAGKPFEFLPLAGFTHMVPDPLVTTRLYQRIAGFLDQHVASADEAGAAARP